AFFIMKLGNDYGIWKFSNATISWAFAAGLSLLVLVPITVAYTIVKHRLFNIHVVVRQSVRYVLARHVLTFLVYLPIVLLALSIRKHRNESIPSLLFNNTSYLFLILAAVILLKYRKQLLNWLDKRFFREAYNSESILLSMIDSVKNITSISELSRWVS